MRNPLLVFFILVLTLGLLDSQVQAQGSQDQLTEYTEEGRSDSTDSVQIRQDIIQDAIEKVSSRLIRELIGDSKFDRQINSIKAKVISQSDKYIPFTKTGEPRTDGTQTRMNVIMKVSQKSLETVLQQSGFMSSNDGNATLLPVVTFSDLVNHKTYQWWTPNSDEPNPFLKPQERMFFESLRTNFLKLGFQLLDPVTSLARKSLNPNLQLDSLRVQDYLTLGESLKAQLVMKGDIKIEEGKISQTYRIVSKITVLHTGNGRVVADSLRSVDTESGPFASVVSKKLAQLNEDVNQDLAAQVNEAWTRGTLGASLVRLAIKGNFEFKTLEGIKDDIKTQVRSVRSISERLFTRNQVEFDIDVEGGADALAKGLGQAHWKTVQLRVESVDNGKVTLR